MLYVLVSSLLLPPAARPQEPEPPAVSSTEQDERARGDVSLVPS